MKINFKNPYLILTGVGLLGLSLLSAKKIFDYSEVIRQMQFYISNINKLRTSYDNVASKWRGFFKMDVTFYNPTDIDFMIDTAGFISVKKIEVFYKGQKIGEANSDVSKIVLPAKKGFTLEDVEFEIVLSNLISLFLTTGLDANVANYKIRATVVALGKTWVIDQ